MNWPLWLDLLVRSAALLLVGLALRRITQSSGAAFRHRLLLGVFALLALLPFLSLLSPEIPLSLWTPDHNRKAYVTVQEISSRTSAASAHHALNWPLVIWILGAAAALFPAVVGSIAAARIARRAVPRSAGVFLSDDIQVPVTCGVFRPRILLPMSAKGWSSSRLDAVLLHEFAHAKRHDLAIQLGAHLVSALWWFQPLVWVLRRELRAESEFACDAEVIRSGFRPSEYAAELLGVAKSAAGDWRFSSSAIGMVRRADLEQRVRAILQPPLDMAHGLRTCSVICVLGAASIAASAVTLGPDQEGSIMKRTILSTFLTSAGLSAATVGGYIHDVSGAPISDAKVSIFNPDHAAKQEAVTDSEGKFSYSDGETGQYMLRIEKPGYASIFRVFDLQADAKIDRDFTMVSEGTPTVADRPIGPVDPPKGVRIGGGVAESNLVTKITPTYPVAAKKAGIQGVVELAVTISKEGVPVDLRVISSPSDDLSESALEAVRHWRYSSTLLNGNPVEVMTTVIVHYTLSR